MLPNRPLLAALLIASVASHATTVVVDQSQRLFNTGLVTQLETGQSFTAGVSGLIDTLKLYTNGQIQGGTNTVGLEIRSGDGLAGPLLGTISLTAGSSLEAASPQWHLDFDLLGLAISVVSGNAYTFAVTSISGPGDLSLRGFLYQDTNPYAGGQLYRNNAAVSGTDIAFETLVLIPEPGTSALLGLGLLVLGVHRRRRS